MSEWKRPCIGWMHVYEFCSLIHERQDRTWKWCVILWHFGPWQYLSGDNSAFMDFSLLARTLGEGLMIPCLRFSFVLSKKKMFKWWSAHLHQFHFLSQDQSTGAQRAETTVAECSLMSCVWACFPNRFTHCTGTAKSAHSDFTGSRV